MISFSSSFEDENQRIINAESMLHELSQDVRLSDSICLQPNDDSRMVWIKSESSSPQRIETSPSPPSHNDWKLKNDEYNWDALEFEIAEPPSPCSREEEDGGGNGDHIDANNVEGDSDNQVSTTSQSLSLTTESSSLALTSQTFSPIYSQNRASTYASSQLTQATDIHYSQFSDVPSFSQSISQSTENGRQFLNIVVRVPINLSDDKLPSILSYPTRYSSNSSPSTGYASLPCESSFSDQPYLSPPAPKCCRKHEKYIKNMARNYHQKGKHLANQKVDKIVVNLDRMFDKMANGNYLKPKFSHNLLCAIAIYSNEDQMIEVSEIYKFLCDSFPYFQKANHHWKNSLRHSLATCNWFLKSDYHRTSKKGYKWTLNDQTSECLEWEIRKSCIKDLRKLYHCLRDGEVLGLLQRMGLVDLSNCSLSSRNSLVPSTFECSQDKIHQGVSSQDHELEQ